MVQSTHDPIEIPFSHRKLFLAILGCFAFVALGLVLISIAEAQQKFPPLAVKVVGVASALLFGLAAVVGCFKLFDSRPGLVVDRDGILFPGGGRGAERIPWDDVSAIFVSTLNGQKFVTIGLVDPESHLARGSAMARMSKRANLRLMGSPIALSAHGLQITFDELHELLSEQFARYHGIASTVTIAPISPGEVGGEPASWPAIDPATLPPGLEQKLVSPSLDWSVNAYRFTLGIGSLALTGMLADLGRGVIPFWAVLLIVLPPLALFVIFRRSDFSVRVVKIAQAIGSVWYISVATGLLSWPFVGQKPLGREWPVYVSLAAIGYIPCAMVLYRFASTVVQRDLASDERSNEFD